MGEVPNRRGAKWQRHQIGDVPNSRGFGMQQTKRIRTDLACSTNYNAQNKKLIQEKQKCGNLAHIGSAKWKRFIYTKPTKSQIGKVPNRRCAK